jgi:hypothetical protein
MRKELYHQNYASQTRKHCHTTHNAKWPKHTTEIGKDATGMMGNERQSGTPRSKFWKKRSALRFHDQTGSNQRVIWGIIAQNVSMLLVLFIRHQWALCVYSSVVISTHYFGTWESPLFHILCDGMRGFGYDAGILNIILAALRTWNLTSITTVSLKKYHWQQALEKQRLLNRRGCSRT